MYIASTYITCITCICNMYNIYIYIYIYITCITYYNMACWSDAFEALPGGAVLVPTIASQRCDNNNNYYYYYYYYYYYCCLIVVVVLLRLLWSLRLLSFTSVSLVLRVSLPMYSYREVRRLGLAVRQARRRENMVGVNMVLAWYPQTTLYHRIYIVHVWIYELC